MIIYLNLMLDFKSLLHESICNQSFMAMYKLEKIVGTNNYSAQFITITSHYKKRLVVTSMCYNILNASW